jgi:hypothetical protein
MRRTNAIYEQEMQWRPAASFVDTWGRLTDRRGVYADRLRVEGSTKTVRAPDGVHLARHGAKLLADVIVPHADGFFTRTGPAAALDPDATCASPHPRTAAGPSPSRILISTSR